MERRFAVLPLLVTLAAVSASPRAQEPLPIGEHGTTILLPEGWKRSRFNKDVPGEQLRGRRSKGFFGSTEVFVVLQEHFGLFENENDYWRLFEANENLPRAERLAIVDDGPVRRVWKQVDHEIDGFRGTFRSELLIGNGHAIHLFCWSARSDRAALAEMVHELVDGIGMPTGASPARPGALPVPQTIARGERELTLSLRPFVMRPVDMEGCVQAWQTADERQGLMVMELTDSFGLERAVDGETETQQAHDASYRELRRAPKQIGGVGCMECEGASDTICYRGLIVPIGRGRALLLRHWAQGMPQDARPDRDAIFASIQLRPRSVPNLPPLPDAPSVTFTPSGSAKALLGGSVRRLSGPGYARTWLRDKDGAWLRVGFDGIDRHVEGRPAKRLLTARAGMSSVTVWNDSVVVAEVQDATVQSIARDGTKTTLPFSAVGVACVGESLLCVRRIAATVLPEPGRFDSQLWLRSPDGTERQLASVASWWGTVPVANGADRFVVADTGESSGYTIVEFDVATGARTATTRWDGHPDVGTASVGWIVNGAPSGRAHGVWHLQPGGALRMLVPGTEMHGVHLDAEGLWFSCQDAEGSALWFAPNEVVDRVRASVLVPDAAQLEELGESLLRELGTAPRTRAEVEAALAHLQGLAKRSVGRELPTTAAELDELVLGLRPVSANGRLVYSLLLAGTALAEGAEWVESRRASWLDWVVAAGSVADHPFAIARHLPSAIVATLDDSEGGAAPAGWLASQLAGRRFLCGVDRQALDAMSATTIPPEFHAAGSPAELVALARSRPTNRFLRNLVYSRLDRAKAWPELVQLAEEAVAAAWTEPDHHVAWLHARARLRATGAAEPAFEQDLLAALAVHGREARLWWLLGESCERSAPPEIERATVCFERVVEIEPYGNLAAAAKAALQRLSAK